MKTFIIFSLFYCCSLFSQVGISYQAVLMNPDSDEIPGRNNSNAFLIDKNICLRFTIISNGNVDYQETIKTTTDRFGIVNVIIGSGIPTVSSSVFNLIDWTSLNKFLKVELDISNSCSNFIEISYGPFSSTPYSLFAINNVKSNSLISAGVGTKISYDEKGLVLKGEFATTEDINETPNKFFLSFSEKQKISQLSGINTGDETNTSIRKKIGIENVLFPSKGILVSRDDSIFFSNLPISTATQTELLLKANATDVITSLASKEDASNKTNDIIKEGASDVKFPTAKAVKTYADSKVYDGINDTITASAPSQNAVFNALALKANATDVITSLASKEDASNKTNDIIKDGTSDVNFPTAKAVKTYADSKVYDGINDSITSSAPSQNAVFNALKLKSNLDSPNFTGTVTAPYFIGDGSGLTNIISTKATNTINSKITEDNTTSTSVYPTFVTASSGDLPLNVATNKISFIPSTGTLTAAIFNGNLNGEASKAKNLLLGSAGEIPYQFDESTTSFIPVGTSGQILKSNGTLAPSWVDLNSINVDVPDATTTVKGGVKISGDLTGSYDNLTIANDKITSAKILNSSVTYNKIQNVSPNRILGNTSSSSTSIQEVEVSGTGKVALNDSPTFINPTLGNATATSINTSGLTLGYKEVSTNTYTISSDDGYYLKFLTDGIVTLPSAIGIVGKRFAFTSYNKNITFVAKSGESIGYSFTKTFSQSKDGNPITTVMVIFSDGANWIIESINVY